MNDAGRILIIGAGPTGLGAAYRLQELGYEDFLLVEARKRPGGLAASHRDRNGFTWDIGGHVQFSHYAYYDDVLERVMDGDWLSHRRDSFVWIKARFVPYPFQNNIHRLDPPDRDEALRGLETAADTDAGRPRNLREWIEGTFGPGIARMFLLPYNFKVWGYPPESLGVRWMGERVAVPDLDRIRQNIRENRDDDTWGPNRTFRFPRRGGTGVIWERVCGLIDPDRVRFGASVASIHPDDRRARLAGGESVPYDTAVSTMPLDQLCRRCEDLDPGARARAGSLVHSSCHVLGVGLEGDPPESLREKNWMYFPEEHSPYYRVTVFSNYSPHNVPDRRNWSLMAEVCETRHCPVRVEDLFDRTLEAMRADRLIDGRSKVVSRWMHREEYGYPTPFLGRDRVVQPLLQHLEARRLYSRGRFGAWRYEVSNQDHSFMQGVELVNRILLGEEEFTLGRPDYVNGGAFLR